MSTPCRCCRIGCGVFAVVTSLILGIITAFLRITGTIALTPAFLWVILGIAVVYLAVTVIAATRFRNDCCESLCSTITALLTGILGTILLSIVFLAIEFVTTSIIGAILTGALLFFFFLTITSVACLVRCFFNCEN
jgi:hypothetical protein